MTDEQIAEQLLKKWQGTGGGMIEALKEALQIGRCQEFEKRHPASGTSVEDALYDR